ncbi:histidine kinase [Microbacterium sp. cx-55]|uniref:sensor histidine kinase n=1 Tax=Microbacterium sp. cx-55 TaxID=2875948 RepID=UPI001CC036F7|nr:histidine kinase [Microbacterium sp. cx-55]MBZ4487507.1 sensor histidine kinase [Microbacterium sp. cx-55]UGB35527.1 histidine kinase [Microbacterium sp. cx-55]
MTDAADQWRSPGHSPFPHPPAWVGDVFAAVIVIGAAFAPFPEAGFRATTPLTIALAIAPALVLPFRRRRPVPALGVVIALFGASSFAGTLSPGIAIAGAIAMFGVANRSPSRQRTGVVLVCAMLAMLLLSLPAAIGSVFDARLIQFAITMAFAAAAGDATRSRRAYIRAMTDRAERAEQTRDAEASRRVAEERLRIARDLHDAVAHQISVISLNAGVASATLESRPERAREALGTIRHASRTVLSEIGNLLEVLRGDERQDGVRVPQPDLDQLADLANEFARVGLTVHTRIEGDITRVGGAVGRVAYRVIQESLTNAHKHGVEGRAHVLVDVRADAVSIVVTNPTGPSRATLPDDLDRPGSRGHGLLGIRERVASVRGDVQIGPGPGGWRVHATLPIAPEPPAPEETP